ncbi:isochorismatase-like protein 3 [Elsinoe australis]|uniref:Isochorismatase-like protein 3 n=1 Tax=Elsinoe australis TaxID=40998 RepID=A0A4U7B7A2_9PEZI|nr:isochorismatase-like protein 3 [Elsinoe australis]
MQLLREELPDDELRPRGRPKNPLPAAPLPPKTKLIAEPYWFPHEGLVRADSTALLLVDMQQDFVNPGGFLDQLGHPIAQARTLIPPLQKLLHAARCAQFPIYHARHSHRHDLSTFTGLDRARIQPSTVNTRTGHPLPTFTAQDLVPGTPGPLGHFLLRQSPGTDPVPELAPLYSELMFDHPRSSVFAYTDLDLVIRNRGIKNIIIAGLSVNASIRDTVRDATDRGFDVCIVEGCVAAQALSKHAAEMNNQRQTASQPPVQTPSQASAQPQPTPPQPQPPQAQMQTPSQPTEQATPQAPALAPAQATPQPAASVQSQTATPAPDVGYNTDLSEMDVAARNAIDDVMPKDTRQGLGFGTIAKFEDLFQVLKTLAKVKTTFPGTHTHPCFPEQSLVPLPANPPPPAYAPPPPPPPPAPPAYQGPPTYPAPPHYPAAQQYPNPPQQYASPYAAGPQAYSQPPPHQPYTPQGPPQHPQYPQQPSGPAATLPPRPIYPLHYQTPHQQPNNIPITGDVNGALTAAGLKRKPGPPASLPPKRRSRGRGINNPIFYQGPSPRTPKQANENVVASVAGRAPRGSQMHNPPPPPGGPLQVLGTIGDDGQVRDDKGETGYALPTGEEEFRRGMMAAAGAEEGREDGEDGDDGDDGDEEMEGDAHSEASSLIGEDVEVEMVSATKLSNQYDFGEMSEGEAREKDREFDLGAKAEGGKVQEDGGSDVTEEGEEGEGEVMDYA